MTTLNKAIALRESGQLEEARTLLINLTGEQPNNPSVWYHCAWAHEAAIEEFPDRREYRVFLAMVFYNLREHGKAMELLLTQLAETTDDDGIRTYKRALLFYSDKLDQKWD